MFKYVDNILHFINKAQINKIVGILYSFHTRLKKNKNNFFGYNMIRYDKITVK